ncbi:hypothetical protein PIB30_023675 [Stylosanthes scabra]|uniref:Uncharacterized protein n=1 Tax=Stylosanthes scabra TaxID=79078 RepID=A0ABU6S9V8_9FABA|nr:hypothetical protein [Stylosanthes scabra]
MREAGYTEQRTPPALNSGGITGRCPCGPIWSGTTLPILVKLIKFTKSTWLIC